MGEAFPTKEMESQARVARAEELQRRALRLLLFRHRMEPGAREWELRQALGKDYAKILGLLDRRLADLGLAVRSHRGEPDEAEEGEGRWFVALREPPSAADVRTSGWRVDDLACLCAAVAYIASRRSRVPRKELEEVLRKKLPAQRVEFNLARFLRTGYLREVRPEGAPGGEGAKTEPLLDLGWRTKAEIDLPALMGSMGSALEAPPAGRRET
jgi:hypothetical protein